MCNFTQLNSNYMCKIGVSNCTQVIKGMATRLRIKHGAVHCAMNALSNHCVKQQRRIG